MARIGLVGFFGWGNYGDELFLTNWQNTIGLHHEVSVVHDLLTTPYFSRQASDIAAEYDALVIGGGDLIIPNKISPLYWNRAWLQRPVYISGVGVPTWVKHHAPDVMDRLRNFFQHQNVRHIGARDEESAQWIRRHLEPKVPVQVHADLVFNMSLPPAVEFEKPTIGINLRTHRADSDPSHLVDVCKTYSARGYDVVNLVLGTGRTRAADLEVAQAFPFADQIVLDSERIDDLSSWIGGLDLLLSNKFHGTVVATMYGVSSVVLSATTKSRNLYTRLDRRPLLSANEDAQMLSKADLARMPVSSAAVRELESEAAAAVRALQRRINADFPGRAPERTS
ncbi:polysaccharide pyruvyl transferase family protein [Kocuria coralli]|uniref:Polysaccharide pyruvyl transferase family protein n=1 Tax=Kocuria coralli TaxID=1461025 RepID=A0A5J5KW70_9MICC|nr:polysaccharide pyruvyl transferase family protein [Kocuria coralli]KAA9393116.1 polysaccharide pyruvyl transferase family protein [Kocuria coralli]